MRKESLIIVCFLVLFANSADITCEAHAQVGYNAAANYDNDSQGLELSEELQMGSEIHRRI
jgi:hypothetical protein